VCLQSLARESRPHFRSICSTPICRKNSPADREITSRLFTAGGTEMRIQAGNRPWESAASGAPPEAHQRPAHRLSHETKGHSAFLGPGAHPWVLLENTTHDLSMKPANRSMADQRFSTHPHARPPPAIDTFSPELMAQVFQELHPFAEARPKKASSPSAAKMFSDRKQGLFEWPSRRFAWPMASTPSVPFTKKVARKMWHKPLAAGPGPMKCPSAHVTNGIHVRSWLSPDMSYVLEALSSPAAWFTRPGRPERLGKA